MENQTDELSQALQQMQHNLRKISDEHSERMWLQTGKNNLSEKLRGDKTLKELSKEIVDFLASYTTAQIGTIYTLEDGTLFLQYAYGITGELAASFRSEEGLIGQVATKKLLNVLNTIPKNYFKIESSLGKENPDAVVIVPSVFDNKTVAVVELGKFGNFSPLQLKLLEETSEFIAISINTVIGKKNLEKLFAQLKEKEQDLNNRVNAINKSNASVEFDLDGTILAANEIFLNLLGYSEKEVVGKHHSIFVEKSYAASKEYRQFWIDLKNGEFQQNEFKRVHKNGEIIWLQGSYNPILDVSGKPTKILKIVTDITATKKQQLEIDAITTAIYKANLAIEFDMNGNVIKSNNIFRDLMGYKENEIVGKHHRMFVEKGYDATPEYHEFWNNLKKGEYQTGEFKRITKKGEVVWIKGNYNPIFDTQGKPYKILKIATDITLARKQAEELLQQAEELQSQQEELRQMNEELEETNEELEEQAHKMESKNREMEAARLDIEQKTKQLEISSRYKSEFLANMSHELRTPLNSLLILSRDLADNKTKNLTAEQVESAEIVNKSGQDLLGLINEVLDLSKIEAGKMLLTIERLSLKDFANELERSFKHQTDTKGLALQISLDKGSPEVIRTDSKRLDQIMRNLLSNAIKFTEEGSVSVTIQREDETHIAIIVKDTGIGVPNEKQKAIFEAFQQADGSTSRKYGGTGLGLSISRELSRLLGGEIKLNSKVNEGSTFTLILPIELREEHVDQNLPVKKTVSDKQVQLLEESNPFLNYLSIADDKEVVKEGDRVILIIEDDKRFSQILLKQAHNKGFKCISAVTGEAGLLLAGKYKPQAIILDLDLPGIDGHHVLAELKANPNTRHIPVHVISVNEKTIKPIKEGALEYLTKPVNKKQLDEAFDSIENFINRKMKDLLIIEDDGNARRAMKKLIGNGDVNFLEAASGKEALAILKEHHIDCIVLDLGLPDVKGFELIYKMEEIKADKMPPIIIYTGKELTREENNELQRYAETIIVKGARSEERLLDETALFLHRTISNLPEAQQLMITGIYDKERAFIQKKILVVDDDMRNVFALSKILKDRGMNVEKAENGIVALATLDKHPDMDLVLMDIMMPEMDGYETMRQIRSQEKFKKLPIIALTAKAMPDDKQKCIDAGANDYITKPVETDRLLSLMRVWLSK